MTCST